MGENELYKIIMIQSIIHRCGGDVAVLEGEQVRVVIIEKAK